MRKKQIREMYKIKSKKRFVSLIGLGIIILAIFVNPLFYLLTLLVTLLGFSKKEDRKKSAISKGYQGEKETVKQLKKLPKDFLIYQYIEFKHNDKKINLDHIVIGPSGLFLIRSTRRNGTYHGHTNNKEWMVEQYTKVKIKNPIKTVKWQTHLLSKYLKSKGFNHFIQPMVFLSDKGSLYDGLEVGDFPVHHNRKKTPNTMVPYIKDYNKGRGLTKEEIRELSKLFSGIGVQNTNGYTIPPLLDLAPREIFPLKLLKKIKLRFL